MDGVLTGFKCILCGDIFPAESLNYTCSCGANLDAVYDYKRLSETWSKEQLKINPDRSIWRYLPLLPIREAPERKGLQVGGTPLFESKELADSLGLKQLLIKDDTRNPSGSLKDRASEIAIAHSREHDKDVIVAASTGNAAASLSVLSAYHGANSLILAPASAPPAKLTQILQCGAQLITIDGTYDQAFDISVQLSEKPGFYSRSTGINPVLSEGKKTAALEICEQSNWLPTEYVFVPVGDGCIIGGLYKGFYDLYKLGWIPFIPKLVAVQAQGSASIVNAIKGNGTIQPVESKTIADSIQVDLPRDGEKAVRAVKNSEGLGITVTDTEILDAQHQLSRSTGVFAEPAAAAAFAGLLKAVNSNQMPKGSSVTILITGTGLKDLASAQKMVQIPVPVKPELKAIEALLRGTDPC